MDSKAYHVTDEHPFYVDGRGWTEAAALRPGFELVSADEARYMASAVLAAGSQSGSHMPNDAPTGVPPSPASNPYDQVPYDSHPYPQTHPARLATVATLLGLRPPDVRACRVLELGCSSGGNLIPMAERLPGATFVGLDGSVRQIEMGRAASAGLRLANLTLLHRDILDVGPDLGAFDYVLVHGVYSWVPPAVQATILRVCRDHLAPTGVAYVSYNTLPGWRMRGVIRDAMSYRARGAGTPQDRVARARALVGFLAESVSHEGNPYGLLLRQELDQLERQDDHYLLHEHLEEHNEPLYFHEFVARAAGHGLRYLGEADFGSMAPHGLSRQVEAVLRGVAGDRIELEQYADFVRNRTFRQTLLCHQESAADAEPTPDRLLGLHVSSPAKPDQPVGDLRADEKVTFRGGGAVTTTVDPLVKAALLHLGEAWPRSVPFADLAAVARSRLTDGPAVVDAGYAGAEARRLGPPMVRCYATGQIELSVLPSTFAAAPGDRPAASAWARHQAGLGNRVTNARHETVRLSDLERHVVRLLDGTRDRAALVDALAGLVVGRELVLHEGGQAVRDAARAKQVLPALLDAAVRRLAAVALLTA